MKIQKVELTPKRLKQLNYLDSMTFPVDDLYPKEGKQWWIAKDGEGPVGFVGLEELNSTTAFICRVGVFQRFTGQGIGRKLIRVAETFARQVGFSFIVSHTMPDNYKSANNLIRMGYRLIKPMANFHYSKALHFAKEL